VSVADVSCNISARLNYGGWTLVLDASVDLAPVTLFVGPNLTGKSLVMCMIASTVSSEKAEEAYPETCPTEIRMGGNVACSIKTGYRLFLDAYRTSAYIYEKVKSRLHAIRRLSEFLENHTETEIRETGEAIDMVVRHIVNLLERDLRLLLNAKKMIEERLLVEAEKIIEKELERFQSYISEMKLQADVDYLLPISISPTDDGYIWSDVAGPTGERLLHLSTGFAAAMVVTALKYAYASARREPVYLFVEEPEAHAGPLQAFFLGHLAAVLTKRAEERGAKLFFVASTHSLDFVRGATSGWTNIYVTERFVNKENRTITLMVKKWGRRDLVPHFFETAALAIRRGIL